MNSPYNSLMNPAAIGQGVMQSFQAGQEQRRQMETRNALAAYAQNPNAETAAGIAQHDPYTGIQIGRYEQQKVAQEQQAQAQAANQRRADMPMLTRLLEHASKGEQQWNEALNMAQQYGIDTSTLPQQFDPQWAAQQAQTMKLLSTPEGQEALSTAGKQAVDMGFQPGTPEFQAKVTEIWQQNGAIPYTDSQGATRLYIPGRGQPTQQAVTEGTVVENDAGERMVLRNGKWEPMTTGGSGGNAGGSF